MIDFSNLALSPNESRAARNFLGLSQAQTAEQSGLANHKLKRFETGNYVPDGQFLDELREFYEGQGYDFHDDQSPGAKARAAGDVFPSGVVGKTGSSAEEETGSSSSGNRGKLPRPETANLQYMRITPSLQSDQIDRAFDAIEDNEAALVSGFSAPISRGFLSDAPSIASQAQAIGLLRRLAENGVIYARLMGRDLLQVPAGPAEAEPNTQSFTLLEASAKAQVSAKTVGELLRQALADLDLAVVRGDKEAQARWKARAEPTEVMQALIG